MADVAVKPAVEVSVPPPRSTTGLSGWLRTNLFATPTDIAITIVVLALLVWIVPPLVRWAFIDAVWDAPDRDRCSVEGAGACWAFIKAKFSLFMYGQYPLSDRWRVNLTAILLVAGLVPMAIPRVPGKRQNVLYLLTVFPIAALVLLVGIGNVPGLRYVETSVWGGLLVTMVVSIVGIVASLPLGILLALGRRSTMPVVRTASIMFIEFWRGVPLITVLFMSSVMLPMFLPPGVNFDKLLRALIGVALFSAAYMAEVVRGGLQAVPKGQIEGANALGLSYWQVMRLVVLPQALRLSIPGIVNSFIALFKDTSLVLIIGIFDLLGIIQSAFTDANWASPTTPITGFAFAALVYWIFCFGMSRYSLFTERRLNAGRRR